MQYNSPNKRTILYYPTISIPSGSWLRQVLLYWDEVGSIVPEALEYENPNLYTPDILFLQQEGVFRAFRPNKLREKSFKELRKFKEELKLIVCSEIFQSYLQERDSLQFDSKIHSD